MVAYGGALLKTSHWGSNEGLMGVVFYTEGITKSYKDVLQSNCFKSKYSLEVATSSTSPMGRLIRI
eukprot:6823123-Ditylum_brightwellii.AAC.1